MVVVHVRCVVEVVVECGGSWEEGCANVTMVMCQWCTSGHSHKKRKEKTIEAICKPQKKCLVWNPIFGFSQTTKPEPPFRFRFSGLAELNLKHYVWFRFEQCSWGLELDHGQSTVDLSNWVCPLSTACHLALILFRFSRFAWSFTNANTYRR